jgi:hypothetical protein
MKRHEKYIEHDGLKDATHLQVSIYYTKGGAIKRGYYLTVTPVTVLGNMVRSVFFTGRNKLLLETQRYSAKQFDSAVSLANGYKDELIAAVVAENKAA